MGAFVTYSNLMTYILPIFCSAICSVFTLLLIWNYRNLAERKLRRVVSIYCILIAVWWSSALWHVLSDDPIFLPVDIPFALSYIYIPILFYNIVLQYRLLLGLFREKEKLSRTELHLAGTHIGNYPDNDSLDVTSRGRTFYQTVVI